MKKRKPMPSYSCLNEESMTKKVSAFEMSLYIRKHLKSYENENFIVLIEVFKFLLKLGELADKEPQEIKDEVMKRYEGRSFINL